MGSLDKQLFKVQDFNSLDPSMLAVEGGDGILFHYGSWARAFIIHGLPFITHVLLQRQFVLSGACAHPSNMHG